MNKFILIGVIFILGGCYTTHTSVYSSYDLIPRERVERQPEYLYENRPYLLLNNNLSVGFYSTAGRSLSPTFESCEESKSNSLTMIVLTVKNFKIDLSKTTILSDGNFFRITGYKTYGSDQYVSVLDVPMLKLNKMDSSVSDFVSKFKINPVGTKSISSEQMTGVKLMFDGYFSCGENSYEMTLHVFNEVENSKIPYKIYFFPWKSHLTPH